MRVYYLTSTDPALRWCDGDDPRSIEIQRARRTAITEEIAEECAQDFLLGRGDSSGWPRFFIVSYHDDGQDGVKFSVELYWSPSFHARFEKGAP